jgi:hypothetical protein
MENIISKRIMLSIVTKSNGCPGANNNMEYEN